MKSNEVFNLIVGGIIIGLVLGLLFSNQNKLCVQALDHAQRLTVLETERAERMATKAITKKAVGFAARCLAKITFGLVKL